MIVWVLEAGCYEDRYVVGIFSTLELGKAAWKPEPKISERWTYQWKLQGYGNWHFDADWNDFADLTAYKLDPRGP